jgi:O-antigen/teichoic acid export membrane protein
MKPSSILDRIRGSLIARNTLWMLVGQTIRTFLQAAYFILLARTLGASGYGAFVGVTALVAILAPFASMGSGNILIKNVARNAKVFSVYWGNSLALTLVSALLLLVVVMGVSVFVLPSSIPFLLVLTVALTDLLFTRLTDVSAQAYQAFQRLGRTAQIQVLVNLCRLVGVVVLMLVLTGHTSAQWGALYLASTALSAWVAVWLVCRELGRPTVDASKLELKEGFYFSISLSAMGIYNDIDKTMLVRLSTLESAGIYGAAYRLIDIAFAPVRSLLFASYARFFQHGETGVRGSLGFAMRFVPLAAGYGLFAGVVLFVMAPIVPWVLGGEYANAVGAIRWLSLIPFFRSVHYFAADTLTGAGHQGLRSAVQVVVAVFNVLANLWVIPAYSWRGAAWSSLASDGLLMVLLWVAVWHLARKAGIERVDSVASTPGRES